MTNLTSIEIPEEPTPTNKHHWFAAMKQVRPYQFNSWHPPDVSRAAYTTALSGAAMQKLPRRPLVSNGRMYYTTPQALQEMTAAIATYRPDA